MRFLGIDHGNKRIGISISDKSNLMANPFLTIENKGTKKAIKDIKDIILKEEITDVVIGVPFSFAFEETGQTKIVEKFIEEFKKSVIDIALHLENEVLSTKEASQKLGKLKNKKAIIDQTASCLILQSFLDKNYGKQ